MKKIFTLLILMQLIFWGLNLKAQLQNLPCTGYNQDVVADGHATSMASTTIDCDGAGYVFVDGSFDPGSGICATTNIWPSNLTISSLITSGLDYLLQSPDHNNDLVLWDAVSDSLTLTTPVAVSNLYVLYTSGGAAGTVTATVTFTDASSQVFSSISTTNWCAGSSPATSVFNRTVRSTSTTCSVSVCQYMYEMNLAISIANQAKSVASIKFTNSNGCVFHAFAVGGNITSPCITPVNQPTLLNLIPGSTTVSGSFTASASADHYLVVRSTSSTLASTPINGTTYTTGSLLGGGTIVSYQTNTTFTDNGPLIPGMQYYYFVFAVNSNCSGGPLYLTISPLTGNTTTTTAGTHDVSISKIISPTGVIAINSTQTVSVQIKNNGTITETSIPVGYRINSLTPVSANWTGSLVQGDSATFVFTTSFTVPAANFNLCAWATTNNDINTQNDTLCKTITVAYTHDVSISSIISPTGIVAMNSTQTVSVRIKNNGTSTETSIPVYYKVNSLTPVSANWTGSLAHGDSVSYSFSSTFIAPTGTSFNLCAYTKLITDQDTLNDKTCKTFNLNVGISENGGSAGIKVSPNPATDKLNIDFGSIREGKTRLSVYNIQGAKIFDEETIITPDNDKKSIDVSQLKSGVYFLRIQNESGIFNNKFIIK
jgi:hypothetical protein